MERTKERIVDSAIRILSEDRGASLDSIAATAGLSRMTIHRYFKNRDTLLEHLHNELVRRAIAIVHRALSEHDDPVDQMREIVMSTANASNGFQLLMDGRHVHEDHDEDTCQFAQMNKKLKSLIERLKENGDISREVPTPWAFHMFDGVVFCAWETMNNGSVAPRDIPELAWKTFTRGLFAEGRC